jgi:hypothetical protein
VTRAEGPDVDGGRACRVPAVSRGSGTEASAGNERSVERACRRADKQIGLEPALAEGLEHADLDGAEAATT